MAFGKDPKQLDEIGSFRQQRRTVEAARPKPSGGGFVWRDRFQPSTDEPDEIRIVKGHHEVELGQPDGTIVKQVLYYFPYTEHFHGTMKKGGVCSAGPLGMFKGKGQPCLGCETYWADKNAGKKNGPMNKRELSAFSVLHYATYGKIPQIDRQTGQPRTNDKNEPYYEWARILPHERHKYQGVDLRDYNVMHWSLGFGHSKVLEDYDKEIGKSCKSCGGRDTIHMEAWLCRGCGEALIDASTTTFSPKEIDEITNKKVRCASCQNDGLLQEMVSCTSCPHGQRADIFDVDIKVKRSAPTDNSNQTQLIVTGWSNPRAIDQRFVEVAKPMALEKIFAPTTYEKQQELWGGRAPVTGQQLSRPYGQGGAGGGSPVIGPGGKIGYGQ